MATDPPYRITTERLTIRCWEPRDAPLLKEAIDTSLDHLRPWMPWARDEPQTLEEKVRLLRQFRGEFDLGQDFVYGMFSADESEAVGGTGLHTRVGDDAFEIGDRIRPTRRASVSRESSGSARRRRSGVASRPARTWLDGTRSSSRSLGTRSPAHRWRTRGSRRTTRSGRACCRRVARARTRHSRADHVTASPRCLTP